MPLFELYPKVQLKWENMWCNKLRVGSIIRSWLGYLHFVWSWQMLGIDRCTKVTCVVWFTVHWLNTWDEHPKTIQNMLNMFCLKQRFVPSSDFFHVLMEDYVFLDLYIYLYRLQIHMVAGAILNYEAWWTVMYGTLPKLKLWGIHNEWVKLLMGDILHQLM